MSGGTLRGFSWIDGEVDVSAFSDARLGARFRDLLSQFSCSIGEPIPLACRDWANAKAAYRFFSNPSVREDQILAGHFEATRERVAAIGGWVLVLQDTTEFCYKRRRPEQIGALGLTPVGRDLHGRIELRQTCGLQMHSSLAITPEGLPLGLCAAKFWTRAKFKGSNALKRKVNPTRVPIEEKESFRWLENMRQSADLLGKPERLVHIGDRENDIYEFFCATQEAGTHFLVRTCVDRLAGDGGHTVADEMAEIAVQGRHRVQLGADETDAAELELRYARIRVRPPIGKQKRYPDLDLTVLHATEVGPPEGRDPIRWKLLTDLPVRSPEEAIEKINWYASRWKIETFHKVLKSGCRAEDAKLRTAERLVNFIAVLCVVAWRVFWLTMMHRIAPAAPPTVALTSNEIAVLDRLGMNGECHDRSLADYLFAIARLGGYLARKSDPPPGNMVIWRGWTRLADIAFGADITTCG